MSRIHREILKNQLFNHDYSNTPVSKTILLDLYEMKLTRQYEGPDGFTHCGYGSYDLGSLVDDMNRQVSRFPDYDLIIVDTK
jgi:hypothetical protein